MALQDLLHLINCHLPYDAHGSLYLFLKKYDTSSILKTIHYFCTECKNLLSYGENVITRCEHCGAQYDKRDASKAGNYFFQWSLTEQLKSLLNSDLYNHLRQECNSTSDVVGGNVYRRLLEREVISEHDISLQWNTDGVSIFKSSNVSVWPIQVCVNELPYNLRRQNVILCGLWFGKEKPDMTSFLTPFVDELTTLHTKRENSTIKLIDGSFMTITMILIVTNDLTNQRNFVILGTKHDLFREELCQDYSIAGICSRAVDFHISRDSFSTVAIVPNMIVAKCVKMPYINDRFCIVPLVNSFERD